MTQEHNEITTAEPEQEIEHLKEELKREHDQCVRAMADFENYRRRAERERSQIAREAKREFILSLLDIVDDFDRALEADTAEIGPVAEGMRAVHRKLVRLLEKEGIHSFNTAGQHFDPRFHEAVTTVPGPEDKKDTVAAELQKGYLWGNDVLRTARVAVYQ